MVRDFIWSRAVIAISSNPLKLALLWMLWMLSWSGSFDRINLLMLSVCGVIIGYVWYCAMRRQLRRKDLSGRELDSTH
jgi:glycopeptide antibiotics resistance protein